MGKYLNNRGGNDKMIQICQNELTNHTHATAHVHTDSVLVCHLRVVSRF